MTAGHEMRLTGEYWLSIGLATCVAILLGCFAIVQFLAVTNCGGNSAALSDCSRIVGSLRLISHERGGLPVSVQNLSDDERIYFEQIDGSPWLGNARLLVSSAAFTADRPQRRRIVAVCDTAFDNVPERLFGKPPPTHAVGYADGSTGLISVDEFQKLDLSGFVDLAMIAARGNQTEEQAETINVE